MNSPVIIKGNRYGIVLVLDEELDFDTLLTLIGSKFKDGIKFFDSKTTGLAITFEGRRLNNEEIDSILDIIKKYTDLDITYVIDSASDLEALFKKSIEARSSDNEDSENSNSKAKDIPPLDTKQTFTNESNDSMFYRGTLRSGQAVEASGSLVVIGDVNPGATVISGGNIVVIGALNGYAYAGANGDCHSFVMALSMNPMQIRISDIIARCADEPKLFKKKKNSNNGAKIAFIEEENIYIEPLSKNVLNDINY